MTSTANVAIVPMIHNALLLIVETNCVIAPAFGGACPVTPAARNASTCAITNAPYTPVNAPPTTRRHPATNRNITRPPRSLVLNTVETPGTPRDRQHEAARRNRQRTAQEAPSTPHSVRGLTLSPALAPARAALAS